jgi:hypothetical protein
MTAAPGEGCGVCSTKGGLHDSSMGRKLHCWQRGWTGGCNAGSGVIRRTAVATAWRKGRMTACSTRRRLQRWQHGCDDCYSGAWVSRSCCGEVLQSSIRRCGSFRNSAIVAPCM